MEDRKKNDIKALMAAFSCPGRPVTVVEYKAFWGSLSEEEKSYYHYADLS